MKVHVNLFKPSGKWAYGGIVEVDGSIPMWDPQHLQNLVNNQNFVVDGAFDHYTVVVTHTEDYDTQPTTYFCQACYPIGKFEGFRKQP